MATIALDHSITIAGVVIDSVPIRPATPADVAHARRMMQREPDEAMKALIRAISLRLRPGEKIAEAIFGLNIVCQVTGLPLSSVVQIDERDQRKIGDFLFKNARA